jgi:hypothetical protein
MVLRLWQQVNGDATGGVLRKKDSWTLVAHRMFKRQNNGMFHEILKVCKGCHTFKSSCSSV